MPICQDVQQQVFAMSMIIWLFFALVYAVMHAANTDHFAFQDPKFDPLYFSSTTTSTVGYGDILPHTRTARIVVMIHQIGVIGLFAVLMCVTTEYFWQKG